MVITKMRDVKDKDLVITSLWAVHLLKMIEKDEFVPLAILFKFVLVSLDAIGAARSSRFTGGDE